MNIRPLRTAGLGSLLGCAAVIAITPAAAQLRNEPAQTPPPSSGDATPPSEIASGQAVEDGRASESALAPREVSGSPLGDIIVTATRRATNVQNVPISITAVGGAELQSKGLTDATQLPRIAPNLFATSGYAPGNIRFAIRGLGSTDFSPAGSSPVGIYVDDVYQPYSFGIGTQIFDLNRVEVLRGPQGTLFGKNTTAGAVSYFSQKPTSENEGYLNIDAVADFYKKVAIEGAFNMPLGDTLAMRADVRFEHREDFVRNTFLGGKLGQIDQIAGRVQFQWRPSSRTDVNLKIFAMNSNGVGTIYHGEFLSNLCDPANFDPGGTPYAQCSGTALPTFGRNDSTHAPLEFEPTEAYHNFGAVLHVDQKLGAWDLTSISSYQKIIYRLATNDDGMPTDIFNSAQRLNGYVLSQELRLATPADKPLSAIIGVYGQYDRAVQPNSVASTLYGPPTNFLLRYDATQGDTTAAGFGSVTWKPTDTFSLIGGLRYSWERKTVDYRNLLIFSGIVDLREFDLLTFDPTRPPFPLYPDFGDAFYGERRSRHWGRLTWDATANFKPAPEVLLYAKASRGFKSGGYNLQAATPDAFTTVEPETVQAYEVGAKNDLFSRRVRINLAGFYYKFENQQVLSTGSNGLGTFLNNAGRSTLKGFEAEMQAAVTEALRLGVNVGYVDATFDRFSTLLNGTSVSLAGNRLPYAPKWTTSADANYRIDLSNGGTIDLQSDWNYRTRVFFDPYNTAVTSDNGLLLGNARITFTPPESNWHIAAYVQNLTDRRFFNFGFFNGTQFASRTYGDGRLIGAQVGVTF
jgi:iron complex outermembrane receptor protein